MTFPAHFASGYLAYKITTNAQAFSALDNYLILAAAMLGANLPDVDYFFSKYIKDHHDSFLHAPLFWLMIVLTGYALGLFFQIQTLKILMILFGIGVFIHLFLDWLSGRTAGIQIFYPFSKKMYSLFPLTPEKGKVTIWPGRDQVSFWRFYLNNKFLVGVETFLILSGMVLAIWK